MQHLGLGGSIRQISLRAQHLSRRGHRIAVRALYATDEAWTAVWSAPMVAALPPLAGRPRSGVLASALPLLGAALRLRKLIRREGIDVVYAFEGNLGRLLGWLATRGLPTTILVWGVQGSRSRRPGPRQWKLHLQLALARAISPSVPLMISSWPAGHQGRAALGFRCRRQLVIANGIDTEVFRPDPEARRRLRSEWGIGAEHLIGMVGRLDPAKGHAVFLEAAAVLARRRPDVRFVIVGGGSNGYRRSLERLSRRLGVDGRVHWAGARRDMAAVYNALDLLCSASLREGGPLVLAEAMASGVPCVTTDVGSSAWILDGTGIVVPPGDSAALAEALDTMLARLPQVDRERLRELIASRFDVDACIEATEAALLEAHVSSMQRQ